MKKNELLIVLAVVLFILIAGFAVYNIVMPLVPEHKEENKTETNKNLELLLKSAEFMKGKTTYQFTVKEKSGDVEKTFFITQDNENAYIKETIMGISREVFVIPNQKILCFDFSGERYCDIANETNEMLIVDGFKKALFSDERAEKEKKRLELLEKSGGLSIHSVEESEINGRRCTLIRYSVDYTKLSINDLEAIGLSPSDPLVSIVKTQNITSCIAETGETLSKQFSYYYSGQYIEEGFVVVDSNYETPNIPPIPNEFTNLSYLFQRHYNIFDEYLTCLQSNKKDKCILTVAVHNHIPGMCEYAENKTACYSGYVSFTFDPALCEKFEPPMKDDCFYTIALSTKNQTMCGLIENRSLSQDCIASFTESPASNQTQ
ncbi:MAG: hypothetical protein QXG02_03125 [Candidatus Anstonellales archaeon]